MLTMLSKLTAIQTREGWPDREMARRLGIARSTWTEIRNERIPLSARHRMAAAGAFPELLSDLLMQVSKPDAPNSEATT
jgi:transcriptional regulator with XRE-family HTH domain